MRRIVAMILVLALSLTVAPVGTGKQVQAETDMAVQKTEAYAAAKKYMLGTEAGGAIMKAGEVHWYKIENIESFRYVVRMKSYMNAEDYLYGVAYALYDENLEQQLLTGKVAGEETVPFVKTADIVLEQGTYYLKVWGEQECTGAYTFSIEQNNKSNCIHDYLVREVKSSYLSPGYLLHECYKCGESYKNLFTPKLKLARGEILKYGMQAGRGKITVSYDKINYVSGYQIRYSTNSGFKKSVKTIKVGKYKTEKTIKKLKRYKRYYVQVRGYKRVRRRIVYGKWSSKRSIKTK